MLSGKFKKKHLYLLLPYGVVAPGVVVGSVLLAGDHSAGVEEVSVCSGSDLTMLVFLVQIRNLSVFGGCRHCYTITTTFAEFYELVKQV